MSDGRTSARNGCAAFSDKTLRNVNATRIEVDEIWAYVAKKQRNVDWTDDFRVVGDQYTFVALDLDSKLIPSWLVGRRLSSTTFAFIRDLRMRLKNRVQISSDGWEPYVRAIEAEFGDDVDYAQIVNPTKRCRVVAAGMARRASCPSKRP
jgi:hypothetical protein